ncbi:copper amine oxidase N-terminal domain-containing protein [Cohnella fermenti]|uniref:Copper amine oxidase N-terminal domain-containing protein n=1 Tax=Cohnella fermenti TaxID=2565925 RepID=A0A4V3WF69_9BACL|nr:copper amine oxidase N-terminal domain-containing protein [Cohnella fermenti]THF79066.1 copper amine oxidase N-terminal domain-containing protein [Cohnella fermenti]
MHAPIPAAASTPAAPASSVRRPAGRNARAAYRSWVRRFVIASVSLALSLILLTLALDPLQFYRKATVIPMVFSTEERYQNPGLAKNFDYDTIIVGTSMTENFLPSVVGEALHGKVMKLAMRGSMADEQYKIAKLALDTGKVKQVLWGLDYFALKAQDPELAADFPDYLYDSDWKNDYKYWFNLSVYSMLFKSVVHSFTNGNNRDLERLGNWNGSGGFSAAKVMHDYRLAQVNEKYFGLNEEPIEYVKDNFAQNILSLVKLHPEAEFIFFYPPYSILRHEVWRQTNETRYRNQLEMSEWMYGQLGALPNTKVYDFQTEADVTFDLDRYKDLSHYSEDVNTWIAKRIGEDDSRYRVTADNARTFTDTLENQLASLLITPDNRVINAKFSLKMGNAEQQPTFTMLRAAGDNELLVPAKEAAIVLGASLQWDHATKTLFLGREHRKYSLTLGETQASADGHPFELDAAPKLVQDVLLVPFRSMAELLGYDATAETPDGHTLILSVQLLR